MSKENLPGTYRIIDHTADLGLEFEASSLPDLLRTAGLALFREMVSGAGRADATHQSLEVSGLDLEDLLIRFLNELLYLFEEERQVITDIAVLDVSERHVLADVTAVPFDPKVHEILADIKAATYHRIRVTRNHTFKVAVIFDV